jgi:hypothetical protein
VTGWLAILAAGPAPPPSPSPSSIQQGVLVAAPPVNIAQLLGILLPLIITSIAVLTYRDVRMGRRQKQSATEIRQAVEGLAGILGERMESKENVALVRIDVARLRTETATLREVVRELNRTVEQMQHRIRERGGRLHWPLGRPAFREGVSVLPAPAASGRSYLRLGGPSGGIAGRACQPTAILGFMTTAEASLSELHEKAAGIRPGRVIVSALTALATGFAWVLVGIGWVIGAIWRLAAFLALVAWFKIVLFIALSFRYGVWRGTGMTDEQIDARITARDTARAAKAEAAGTSQ